MITSDSTILVWNVLRSPLVMAMRGQLVSSQLPCRFGLLVLQWL